MTSPRFSVALFERSDKMEVAVQRCRRDLEVSPGIPSAGQFAPCCKAVGSLSSSRFSSDRFPVAFIHHALVRLTAALDPVLRFAAVLRKFPENRVVTSGGRPRSDTRPQAHRLPGTESMCHPCFDITKGLRSPAFHVKRAFGQALPRPAELDSFSRNAICTASAGDRRWSPKPEART